MGQKREKKKQMAADIELREEYIRSYVFATQVGAEEFEFSEHPFALPDGVDEPKYAWVRHEGQHRRYFRDLYWVPNAQGVVRPFLIYLSLMEGEVCLSNAGECQMLDSLFDLLNASPDPFGVEEIEIDFEDGVEEDGEDGAGD